VFWYQTGVRETALSVSEVFRKFLGQLIDDIDLSDASFRIVHVLQRYLIDRERDP
jgi:hypothetical protein